MPQLQTVRGVATSIRTDDDGMTHVRYHDTDVVSFDATTVTLRSDGWETATTKLRMNQASHQFNLGFTVYAVKRVWWVLELATGGSTMFHDGMTFPRRPVRWTGERWVAA